MKTVTSTALANFKKNKGRNILNAIAIGLTTLLICMILTVGFGTIKVRNTAVNEYFPTWHLMYRSVSEDVAEGLLLHNQIETAGLRSDFGQLTSKEANILMIAMDETALRLNNMTLEEGEFPKNRDDIVLSQGVMDVLGFTGKIGDYLELPVQISEKDGLGYSNLKRFRISGIMETAEQNKQQKIYSVLCSTDYMKEEVPREQREYRVMVRLNQADKMTTSDIKTIGSEIATSFEIAEKSIVENKEYLLANYLDPTFFSGIVAIILLVVCAGIITTYSIYYVSMVPKIQEFGKLKVLGTTKKQVRQIVSREGMLVAAVAIPIGLILSTFLSGFVLNIMYRMSSDQEEFSMITLRILEQREISIYEGWIYAVTIAVALFTVWIALKKPMSMAAKISPIEAVRYNGEVFKGKKERKGYRELTILRLTKANLVRNKKRTILTILTLSATGILFFILATVLTCARPEDIAKEGIEGDFAIMIESRQGDKMNPEMEWSKIQQKNPMDTEFLEKIQAIPGVEKVNIKQNLSVNLPEYNYQGELWTSSLLGFDESYAKMIEGGVIAGSVTYEELKKGDKVVVNKNLLRWFPNIKIGDKIQMQLNIGDSMVDKSFEVAAIGAYSYGVVQGEFLLPTSVLQALNPYNLNYFCSIEVKEEQKKEAYAKLTALAEETGKMITSTYEESLESWNSSMKLMSVACYTFLIILLGIGILNLINTMISSIHTRSRELGMMQAVGLSEKQMLKMLQMEGSFYTVGMMMLTLGVGGVAGYFVFLIAKEEGILSITKYHFPLLPAVVFLIVIFIVQFLLTCFITKNFRKRSMVERIRHSE